MINSSKKVCLKNKLFEELIIENLTALTRVALLLGSVM